MGVAKACYPSIQEGYEEVETGTGGLPCGDYRLWTGEAAGWLTPHDHR